MNEPLKHRLIGGAVVLALLTIFAPLLLRNYNQRLSPHAKIDFSIPEAPPKVIVTSPPIEHFETLPVTRVDLSTAHQQLNVTVKKRVTQASKKPTWVIQLGSFSQKRNASLLVKRLKRKGYAAHYLRRHVKHPFRVFVQLKGSKQQATQLAEQIHRRVHIRGIVKRAS